MPGAENEQLRRRKNRFDEDLQGASADEAGVVAGIVVEIEAEGAWLFFFDDLAGGLPDICFNATTADGTRDGAVIADEHLGSSERRDGATDVGDRCQRAFASGAAKGDDLFVKIHGGIISAGSGICKLAVSNQHSVGQGRYSPYAICDSPFATAASGSFQMLTNCLRMLMLNTDCGFLIHFRVAGSALMKAIRFHQHGGPDVLKYEDVPDPVLRKDQVLVRVKAVALNHLDLFVRQGVPGVPLPQIPGSDIAGDVADVGEYISDIKPGTRILVAPMSFCGICEKCVSGQQNFCPHFSVFGYRVPGGDSELFAASRINVLPIPDELTYDEAASVPLVFLTAWHMLVGRAKIKPGQTVLVLGGRSGVGSAAIQVCKLWNCQVIATAGSESKLDHAGELGADFTIDHYKQKISEEVKKLTAKQGVD